MKMLQQNDDVLVSLEDDAELEEDDAGLLASASPWTERCPISFV
jgi:hypothetical protein